MKITCRMEITAGIIKSQITVT